MVSHYVAMLPLRHDGAVTSRYVAITGRCCHYVTMLSLRHDIAYTSQYCHSVSVDDSHAFVQLGHVYSSSCRIKLYLFSPFVAGKITSRFLIL